MKKLNLFIGLIVGISVISCRETPKSQITPIPLRRRRDWTFSMQEVTLLMLPWPQRLSLML